MESTPRFGSCLCEKVKVQLIGKPERKVLCHCLSCQKSSGAIFEANVFYREDVSCHYVPRLRARRTYSFPKQKVEFKDPESMIRVYHDSSCDSGGTVERSFCSNCGSHVRTLNKTNPWVAGLVIVPIGIIEGEKESLRPVAEYYVKRRAGWQSGLDGAEQSQAMT